MGEQHGVGWVRMVTAVAVLVARYRPWRRKFMFYLTIAALFQAAAGITVLEEALRRNVWVYLCYWGGCAVLVAVMALAAIYDILAVRSEQQEELRRLRESIFGKGTRP